MIYKDFQGKQLSALGLGCMRFPVIDGNMAQIDEAKTAEMVDYAMKNGINYYDTAYGYHGGTSEPLMGKLLSKYPRESFYLASKFPGYDVKNLQNKEQVFASQLQRCQTEYFDFYLCHSVTDTNIDNYLDPQYGLLEYLKAEKAAGRIRHLGFSCHASLEQMERFIVAAEGAVEFCQIQLNWLDWTLQDAKAKVEMLAKYGIPVWVMEPVRGGALAKLKDDMLANFAIEKALNSVTVKEEEVQKLYDEHKSEFMAGESVEASHILVDTEEKANEILAEIKAETISFEDAARKYSSCPSSSNGGALGEFGRGQMVPEFDTAVFAMNVGEVSEPVKTQFGYHLIKLTNKKEAAEVPYAQMRERLYQMVLSEKQRAAYNSKVNQLKIMFPVDIF